MARDRQRAKDRQAERRAARRAERAAAGDGAAEPDARDGDAGSPESRGVAAPGDPALDPTLSAGAPPEETGRSDAVLDTPPEDQDVLDEEDEALEQEAVEAAPAAGPRGRRGAPDAPEDGRRRARVVEFLVAVVAELKRVQWPNRQALGTLTGVVLAFVILMGLYLGGLDAVASRVINAIL